jgi:hypothetical protein
MKPAMKLSAFFYLAQFSFMYRKVVCVTLVFLLLFNFKGMVPIIAQVHVVADDITPIDEDSCGY